MSMTSASFTEEYAKIGTSGEHRKKPGTLHEKSISTILIHGMTNNHPLNNMYDMYDMYVTITDFVKLEDRILTSEG